MGRSSTGRGDEALVVVVDDDQAARISIEQVIRLRGYRTRTFSSAEAALAWPALGECDCIVSDVKMPGMDGERFLLEVIRQRLPCPMIMITGHGRVSMAVRCLKAGAYDFVEKPYDADVLIASVRRATEKSALHKERAELKKRLSMSGYSADEGRFGMIGRSRAMQELYARIELVAASSAPVLVQGETGSGKELVARALHMESDRSRGPFVALNAAAIPQGTIESELFGHVRGAFTSAESARDGKLVTASGGTLLLDEVESISPQAQAQLLRVLEDGQVFALGKDTPRKVDVRLIATTKVDPKELVTRGEMREDFYHRIMVFPICVPPLRERLEDLPLLVLSFLNKIARRDGLKVPSVGDGVFEEMIRYPWPGNVRELKHSVERMLITAREGIAGPFMADGDLAARRLLSLPATDGVLREALEETERAVIEEALKKNRGEVVVTAQALGISRRALYERMKRYDLRKDHYKVR